VAYGGPIPDCAFEVHNGVVYVLVPDCRFQEYRHGDITYGESPAEPGKEPQRWIIYQHNGVTYVRPR
jgi:hypothetical protein